jgi:colicin import membrane protein
MAGNRERERKDPLPLAMGRGERRSPQGSPSAMEPVLRALARDTPPEPDNGFAAPNDLRETRQARRAIPGIAIGAFAIICLCAGAYGYWRLSDTGSGATSSAAASAEAAPPADAAAPPPLPTQAVDTRPQMVVPGNAAPVQKIVLTEQAREKAAAARLAAEQALRDKLHGDKARAEADDAARAKARTEHARMAEAQRDREQQAQAEKTREAAAAQAQRAREQQAEAAKARQAAAQRQKQLAEQQAEQRRVAAARHHQDELRAARQRKEAATRRVQQSHARAEAALEQKLDAAAQGGSQAPAAPMRSASLRHGPSQAVAPLSAPGDSPPLDISDLPPPAHTAP